MTDIITKSSIKDEIKVERPHLHKVILVNDDFTPREFVVTVLKAEFRMSEDQALRVMMTAHRRGVCVVAVFTKDVAEAKEPTRRMPGAARAIPYCSRPSRRNKAAGTAAANRWRDTTRGSRPSRLYVRQDIIAR
jgi:ATP-dependent Clp protease adaptor protein ClpS